MSIYSRLSDLSTYAIAGASYYWAPSGANFVSSFLCGAQAFAISSVFDKAVREDLSARMTLIAPLHIRVDLNRDGDKSA